jgi:putative pyruvate formate lyase activating enzyme
MAPRPRDLAYAERVKADAVLRFQRRPENADYRGEFNVPILWNSNFFMSEEATRILRTIADVWLPDFKFGSDKCSIHLSRTPWYWETVTRNLKLIHGWGEDFVIRHLVMPNHVDCCTKPVLDWIKLNMPRALVNVMDQYHPDCFADPCSSSYDAKFSDINRYPLDGEILESFRYAKSLGLNFEPLTYEKNMTGLSA